MGQLIEAARAAVDRLFTDTTVSQATTKGRLEDLRDHIVVLIESLHVDEDEMLETDDADHEE